MKLALCTCCLALLGCATHASCLGRAFPSSQRPALLVPWLPPWPWPQGRAGGHRQAGAAQQRQQRPGQRWDAFLPLADSREERALQAEQAAAAAAAPAVAAGGAGPWGAVVVPHPARQPAVSRWEQALEWAWRGAQRTRWWARASLWWEQARQALLGRRWLHGCKPWGREGAAALAGHSGARGPPGKALTGLLGDSAPWTNFNDSELTPVVPWALAWLLAEAEERLRNASATFDLGFMVKMARLQSVAYCHQPNVAAWNCTRCRHSPGFLVETTVYDLEWDLFGYAGFSPHLDAMVISFKGTDSHSLYNWAENMRYWRTDLDVPFPGSEGASVHTGWFVSWNNSALAPNITAAVSAMARRWPGKPLYAVGHSMGAAIATVAALDLKFSVGLRDVHLYTFGSPRVGNDVFAAFTHNQTTRSVRVTHNRDIVPSVPPEWVGFHHVAREVWQIDVDGAAVIGICDSTGEDARCHNSVCFLGLCTSVSDHLHYLGVPMYNGTPVC